MALRWRSDFEKYVIVHNFERRAKFWRRIDESVDDPNWNFYWANVHNVRALFSPESGTRLGDNQLINHFPNHIELTRKDLMVKNIKRYQRELHKDTADQERRVPEMVPVTYILPADYSLFVEEFRRSPNCTWIMKPAGKSQGVGIFIINKLTQIKKWANRWSSLSPKDWYVVSRYIEDPLLIGGKKFDLRLCESHLHHCTISPNCSSLASRLIFPPRYVLVTSFRPLRVYSYSAGFGRFCSVKYTSDIGDIENPYIHLTNVAIQKKSDDYNKIHGGKWTLSNMRIFLQGVYGHDRANRLFEDMNALIIHSLKACQNVMINDKHCFECYGYDLLIDAQLKPWLLEVNASPSLTTTTTADRVLKTALISDLLDIVMPAGLPVDVAHKGMTTDPATGNLVPIERLGEFELLYDEAQDVKGNCRPTLKRLQKAQ